MTVQPGITTGGIMILVTLLVGILGIIGGIVKLLMTMRDLRLANEAVVRREIDEAMKPLADRMARVEVRNEDFMPKSQISDGFSHEKNARLAVGQEVIRLREDHAAIRERQAKVEQRLDGFGDSMAEIKVCQREINAKLDKLIERQAARP